MTNPPLQPSELELVRSVLRQHPEVQCATLFGSRAKGTHHDRSDQGRQPCRGALIRRAPSRIHELRWSRSRNSLMRSTITSRGQTVVPAPIRERFRLGPSTRLEWLVESDGSIRVVPVDADPITAFRGSGPGGSTARLLAERQAERLRES